MTNHYFDLVLAHMQLSSCIFLHGFCLRNLGVPCFRLVYLGLLAVANVYEVSGVLL